MGSSFAVSVFDSRVRLTLGPGRHHNDHVYVASAGSFFLRCSVFVSLKPGIGLSPAGTTIHNDSKSHSRRHLCSDLLSHISQRFRAKLDEFG